jgi:Delta7-sterol 5-desaturase
MPFAVLPAGAAVAPALDAWLGVAGPWALVWSLVFATHVGRYVLTSGAVAIAVEALPLVRGRRLQDRTADELQRRLELRGSLEAGAIFALQFLPLAHAIPAGWTRVYFDVSEHGWLYLVASFPLALLVHDAYFYWTHRWMHRPGVFARVHRHHHRSRAPSAWAAFAFQPAESTVQGAIHLLIPVVMPIHVSVLSAFVIFASLHSALIHCGHDVFGVLDGSRVRPHGRWLNTALDHDAHHAGAPGNFALYFSVWDRWMGTHVSHPSRSARSH